MGAGVTAGYSEPDLMGFGKFYRPVRCVHKGKDEKMVQNNHEAEER